MKGPRQPGPQTGLPFSPTLARGNSMPGKKGPAHETTFDSKGRGKGKIPKQSHVRTSQKMRPLVPHIHHQKWTMHHQNDLANKTSQLVPKTPSAMKATKHVSWAVEHTGHSEWSEQSWESLLAWHRSIAGLATLVLGPCSWLVRR